MERSRTDLPDFEAIATDFPVDPNQFRTNRLGIAGINFKMLSDVMGKAAFRIAEPEVVTIDTDTPDNSLPETEPDDNIESLVVLSETD